MKKLFVLMLAASLLLVGCSKSNSDDNPKSETKTTTTAKAETKDWSVGGIAISGTFADASVVKTGADQYRIYYGIQPEVPGNQLEVYSATSSDGITWQQETGTRHKMSTFPEVIKLDDGRYRMYFQNAAVIKSAISSDGLTFVDEAGTRIDKENSEGLVFDNVAAPTILKQDDGSFLMVYRGTINERYAADTPNSTTQLLMWATSQDGLTFEKKGIAVDSRNADLRGQLDGPSLVKWDDDKIHMFVTTYSGVWEFIRTGDKFNQGENVFTLGSSSGSNTQQSAPPPGDPSVIKIGDTWQMYYGTFSKEGENGISYATFK